MNNSLTNLWDSLFDQIYVINLEGNGRKTEIVKELTRVGILQTGKVFFHHSIKSPLKSKFLETLMPSYWLQNRPNVPYAFDCAFGHYECWIRSKQLNHNRILVIEDDCRFLKNLNELKVLLENIPINGDVILFDYLHNTFNNINENNNYYIQYKDNVKENWSAACYSINSNAISFFVKKQEEKLQPADEIMVRYSNEIDLNRFFCSKHLGVQCYRYNIDKWNKYYFQWCKIKESDYLE